MINQPLPKGKLLLSFLSAAVLGSLTAKAQTLTWYQDLDGDGWGNPYVSVASTTQPTGYVLNSLDCDDGSINASRWTPVDSSYLADSTNEFSFDMTIDHANNVYITYQDVSAANYIPQVEKFNGVNFEKLPPITSAANFAAGQLKLAVGPNDTLFALFPDVAYSYRHTVKKYTGTSWVTVGNAGFTPSVTQNSWQFEDLVVDANGQIYMAYLENDNHAVTIMKYNPSTNLWGYIGSRMALTTVGTGSGEVFSYLDLKVDANGNLYVSVQEKLANTDVRRIVKKYSGNTWVTVGSMITTTHVPTITNAISTFDLDLNGVPHVLYSDPNQNNKATLVKLINNAWVAVGGAGFSDTVAENTRLSFDLSGNVYALYGDYGYPGAWLTMKKYDGTSWSTVGNDVISTISYFDMDCTVAPNGVPYVLSRFYLNNHTILRRLAPVGGVGTVAPDKPLATATPDTIPQGDTTVLSITGNLNDASAWVWYTDSCGGAKVVPLSSNATGSVVSVKPLITTTYYVRGEGGCMPEGPCDTVTVVVHTVSVNSIKAKDIDVVLYPNPNNGTFTVNGRIGKHIANTKIAVLNSVGQVVYQEVLNADNGSVNATINLPANIPAGTYTISFNIEGIAYYKRITVL